MRIEAGLSFPLGRASSRGSTELQSLLSCPRFKSRLRKPEEGADTIVWLACVPKEMLVSGEFYFDRDLAAKHLTGAGTQYMPKLRDQLYRKVQSRYEGTLEASEVRTSVAL